MAMRTLLLGQQPVKRRTLADKPALIPICSSCGLIRDETGAVAIGQEHWVTKRTYVKTHGVNLADCDLTHTYCPGCFTDFVERVRPRTSSIGIAL
jgi:hypothetical protein